MVWSSSCFLTLRHKEFSGIVGEAPLGLREGASLNPVSQRDFDFKLGKSEEYTCGINAAWVSWSWTVVPKVPIVRTSAS